MTVYDPLNPTVRPLSTTMVRHLRHDGTTPWIMQIWWPFKSRVREANHIQVVLKGCAVVLKVSCLSA